MEHDVSLAGSSRPSNNNHVLPFELLGEVFSYISDDPLDLRYAIFVCRPWHNAIVHCAKLWTNIIIMNPDRSQGDRLPHTVAFIRLCLSRSSGRPLHMHISIDGFDPDSLSFLKDIVAKSGESGALFQRCKSLTWTCSGSEEISFVAQAFTSASAPALEYLTIDFKSPAATRCWVHFPLPRLKEVTLRDNTIGFGPRFFHDDAFATAERLTLITTAWYHSINFIRRFQSIRALVLENPWNIFRSTSSNGPVNPMEFPLLETLAISGFITDGALNVIRAPALRKMEVKPAPFGKLHSLGETMHLARTLECLYFSVKNNGAPATSWDKVLERFVAEAPVLVSVWVSPWMVEDLKGREWLTGLLHVSNSI